MCVRNEDTKSRRQCITKTDAAYSLLELHSSLENRTKREELAAQTLLDLESSCHRSENNTSQSGTDINNVNENNEYTQVDTTVILTVENTENKYKEVETRVNNLILCVSIKNHQIKNFNVWHWSVFTDKHVLKRSHRLQ